MMSWFDLIYFGLMLLLALWLIVGLFLALREKMLLGTAQPFAYNPHTSRERFIERTRSSEFTSSNVREAFEMFLNNFEPGNRNQNR